MRDPRLGPRRPPTTRPGPSRQARTGRRWPSALPTFVLAAAVLLPTSVAPLAAQESGDPPAGETAATPSAREGPSEAPFTEERFEALQARNALILVDVYADWCPVCMAQQNVLADFREKHPDVPLHVLKVDFDEQKEWVRHFEAPRQSTLILYRGEERLWFSVAENRRDVIFGRILLAAGGIGVR